jgi:prepilin-type processing-associated H-X9-DG protein
MIDAHDHPSTTQQRSPPVAARPWRKLELRHLFIGVAGMAMALVVGRYNWPYYAGAAYSLLLLEVFAATLFFTRRFLLAIAAAMVMIVLPCGLSLSFTSDRHPHAAYQRNNVRQIMLALKMYERDFGTLPPAYVADAEGRPLYSWRVLILPYLEQQTLYDQFHLDESWNSSHNLLIAAQRPDPFAHPRDRSKGVTRCLVVAGEGTLMGTGEPTDVKRLGFSPKSLEQRILLIEYPGSDVFWTEPRELSPLAVIQARSRGELDASPPRSNNGAHVGYYDGHVEVLGSHRALNDSNLRARLTLPVRSSP